jgi:predicted metal-dependent phosphotriesterase family hydrolase
LSSVETVRGPVAVDELGRTLMYEHIIRASGYCAFLARAG